MANACKSAFVRTFDRDTVSACQNGWQEVEGCFRIAHGVWSNVLSALSNVA
ncbi:MAG: hypothetical protein QW520_04110 [Methanomassiliicoccales archaeon]